MILSLFLVRLCKLMVFGLGRAGLGCGQVWGWTIVLACLGWGAGLQAQPVGKRVSADKVASRGMTPFDARQAMHQEEAWLSVAAHLPDPKTASWEKLESAGDVLRARRYPEDALDYYFDSLQRGAPQARLLNKMGVTELGLRDADKARLFLKLALKRDKKDAEAWNNLGATEYMDGRTNASVDAYRKAIKLKPGAALFHGNLATALVEKKDFDEARKELAKALELDPEFGTKRDSEAGIAAHVLSPEDRARYCFEMARAYAARGMVEAMLHSLAMAAESGMDIREKMLDDAKLKPYVTDERVVLVMQNAKAMQNKPMVADVAGKMVPLPTAAAR